MNVRGRKQERTTVVEEVMVHSTKEKKLMARKHPHSAVGKGYLDESTTSRIKQGGNVVMVVMVNGGL